MLRYGVIRPKPLFFADPEDASDEAAGRVKEWVMRNGMEVLNVAGPRESKKPGIYSSAKKLLVLLLESFSGVKSGEGK